MTPGDEKAYADDDAVTTKASRIVRLPEVCRLTGLSRSTVYERIREDRFPQPVNLGGRSVGWLEAEVSRWIVERVAATRLANLC